MIQYVVVYLTDNNDLYYKKFETQSEVDSWFDEWPEYKAIVVSSVGIFNLVIEDRT